MGSQDPSIRQKIAVSSVPSGLSPSSAAGTVGANSWAWVNWQIVPDSPELSLWNWLWTVCIDVNDDDHNWPGGNALTLALSNNIQIMGHPDFNDSNDATNSRFFRIYIKNTDTSSHAVFIKVKAYTVTSASSGSGVFG